MKTFNKADIIELLSSITVLYMVQKAVIDSAIEQYGHICAIPREEYRSIIDNTTKKFKTIRTRAIKAGISNKCILAIDNKAHSIAHNFYI